MQMQQVIGKSVHICSTVNAKNTPLLLKKTPLIRKPSQKATHKLNRENSGLSFVGKIKTDPKNHFCYKSVFKYTVKT